MKPTETDPPRKKTPLLLYAALLFVISLLPAVSMLSGNGGTNTDNRTLSGKPELLTADGLNASYGEQCDTYITEHIGFRGSLIYFYNMFGYYIFRTSAVPKVTAGRDGWLFYTEAVEGTRGRNLSSPRTVYRLAKTSQLIDEYVSENGGLFIFAVVPNKASVYPEMLRKGTYISHETDLERLRGRLSGKDHYLDLYGLFRESDDAGDRRYYYKYDSHWNGLGALRAYRAIQRNLAARAGGYSYNNYDDIVTERREHTGDLGKMLLPGHAPAEYEDAPVYPGNHTSAKPVTDPLYRRIETFSDTGNPSLLVLRDSFGSALIDPLSDNFSHVLYSTVLPYDICQGGVPGSDTGYDIVIIETAERNLLNLISGAPELPASRREMPVSTSERGSRVACAVEPREGGVLVSGSLGGIDVGTEDDIYIEASAGGRTGFFEAFPISRSDARDDGAFFALLPEEYSGADSLFVHVGNSGHTDRYPLSAAR